MDGELKLVFPTKEYKEQMEEYLQEHIENGELELAGDGSLDTIKDVDKWLKKVKDDVTIKDSEKVPATIFLGVRKSDNKVVGTIQIRHYLNEKLYKTAGHIGEGVRPSERKKGYATEMIRLALEECRKMKMGRVLMMCYKDNEGSRKSIIKNGGVLESEELLDNGKIDQRYWISLKKRFTTDINRYNNIVKMEQKIIKANDENFQGDVYAYNLLEVSKPSTIPNGLVIQANNYKWLEFYKYGAKVKMLAVYNDRNEIVEWYFDIARNIGKENGLPYEDDFYLDVVLRPNGETLLLDEDEFEDAYKKMEMTKEEHDEGYKIAYELIDKIKGKAKEMKEFTDKYLKMII